MKGNKPTNAFLWINRVLFSSSVFIAFLIIQSVIPIAAVGDPPPLDVFVKITAEETTSGKSLTILNVTTGLGSKFIEDGVDVTGLSSKEVSHSIDTLLRWLGLNRNSNVWINVDDAGYILVGRLTPKGVTPPAAYNPSSAIAIKVPGINILRSIPRAGPSSSCPIPLDCIPYFNEFVETTNHALNNYGKKVIKNLATPPDVQLDNFFNSIPAWRSFVDWWGSLGRPPTTSSDPNAIVGVNDGGADGASWAGAGESGSWGSDTQKPPSKPISSTSPPTEGTGNFPEKKSQESYILKVPFNPNHPLSHQLP